MKNGLSPTDEQLACRAQNGDGDAAEVLMHRYKNAVAAGARRFFLAGAAEEDVLQEGMIGLYRAIINYREGLPFAAYAKSCIKNGIIDAVKNAGNGGNKPLNNYLPIDEQTELASPDEPERSALENDEKRRLERFFSDNLTKEERDIIELYLSGDSYKTIAEKLNLSLKKVDYAIQRVKTKIRKSYIV